MRKRTNIATQLITEPDILFLDEPTVALFSFFLRKNRTFHESGLDSANAMNTMEVIKELIGHNKVQTVVASIHQPSSQLFHL